MTDPIGPGAYQVDGDVQERDRLARRQDLTDRFGIVLGTPIHGQDRMGNWRYGIGTGIPGSENHELVTEFTAEMMSLVTNRAESLVAAGVITHNTLESAEIHRYESGPAAASWPQFFIDLYEQLNPALTDGATLLAWAYFLKDVATRLKEWKDNKEGLIRRQSGAAYAVEYPSDYTPSLVLTRPALVALCYANVIEQHGVEGDITIDVLPRNRFRGYASADHPSGGETYLIRFQHQTVSFYYLVHGNATVSEHFVTTGDEVTLLQLPDLLPSESSKAEFRQPEESQRLVVSNQPQD